MSMQEATTPAKPKRHRSRKYSGDQAVRRWHADACAACNESGYCWLTHRAFGELHQAPRAIEDALSRR